MFEIDVNSITRLKKEKDEDKKDPFMVELIDGTFFDLKTVSNVNDLPEEILVIDSWPENYEYQKDEQNDLTLISAPPPPKFSRPSKNFFTPPAPPPPKLS